VNKSSKKSIVLTNDYILIGLLLLLFAAFSFFVPSFFTFVNLSGMLGSIAVTGTLALGVSIALIAGAIDFSIAATAAFTGILITKMLSNNIPVIFAILLVMVSAVVIGTFNGLLVAKLRINAFITTLATMGIIRGLAFIINGGSASKYIQNASYYIIGSKNFFFIPVIFVVMLLMYLVGSLFLSQTITGRKLYAVGGNFEACKQVGIRTGNYIIMVYIICAVCSAIGGIFLSSRLRSGVPNVADGWEFDIITAVIFGGISLWGGIGSLKGTLIAILVLGVLWNGLTIVGVSTFYQYIIRGSLLIIAITLDKIRISVLENKRLNAFD
jgi:ribose/xylose/arabinose/galactoside ABC-type transport system permease subunit